jgi:putative FmdB family regulatory protein
MPHYEFLCRDCQKFFDKILSLVDCEEGEIICPRCNSKNVEQRWSAVSDIAPNKSA